MTLPAKGVRPRRPPAVRCQKQRCNRRVYELGLCKNHLKTECDRLCGAIIRSQGYCDSGRDEHDDVLQWSHGFSRSYLATRWLFDNGFCHCRKCHKFFTEHPLEWTQWLKERWGHAKYEGLYHKALSHVAPDMGALLVYLRIEAEKRGVA